MSASRAFSGLLVVLAVAVSGCSVFYGDVSRRVHGRTTEGPFVSPEAYAAFTRGSVHEARKELPQARDAYLVATREAPDAAEPFVRLGAVQCLLGEDPAQTFGRAEARDPELASLWLERSRCFLAAGKLDRAVAEAERAVALAPADVANSLALLAALSARKDVAGERRWRAAALARFPDDPRLDIVKMGARGTVAQIDAALRAGDEDEAERLARSAGISLPSLSLRAAALGKIAHARRLSALVSAADPASGDARVALVVATDLAGDEAAYREALRSAAAASGPASPLALALLNELLHRRTGVGLPKETMSPEADELTSAVRARSVAGLRAP